MTLLVDMPNEKYGNTNDGNTCNAEKSWEITGIPLNFVQRFQVILECLASGYEINSTGFDTFTVETCNIYLGHYPWYYMPLTVHTILFNGKFMIDNCILDNYR